MKDKLLTAVALKYNNQKNDAPIVAAKGRGLVAENIIQTAKEHDIPIQEDPSLVEILSQLNINDQIPEELYKVVAEIFAYIYKIDQSAKQKYVDSR
jgi:flagellar biosynthesis protein